MQIHIFNLFRFCKDSGLVSMISDSVRNRTAASPAKLGQRFFFYQLLYSFGSGYRCRQYTHHMHVRSCLMMINGQSGMLMIGKFEVSPYIIHEINHDLLLINCRLMFSLHRLNYSVKLRFNDVG